MNPEKGMPLVEALGGSDIKVMPSSGESISSRVLGACGFDVSPNAAPSSGLSQKDPGLASLVRSAKPINPTLG